MDIITPPLIQVHHASVGGGRWWQQRSEQTRTPHASGRGGLRGEAAGDPHHDQVCRALQHQASPAAHLRRGSASRRLRGSCELLPVGCKPQVFVLIVSGINIPVNVSSVFQLESWPGFIRSRFSFTVYSISFPSENAAEWKKLFKPCASQRLFLPVSFR